MNDDRENLLLIVDVLESVYYSGDFSKYLTSYLGEDIISKLLSYTIIYDEKNPPYSRDIICFDVSTKEVVFSLKTNGWIHTNENNSTKIDYKKSYINFDYFDKPIYNIIDVRNNINYPCYEKICKKDNIILWAKKNEIEYVINFDYFPTPNTREGEILLFLNQNENLNG